MKVDIFRIIKKTSGGFHSWCESNVGIIRKPNNKILLYDGSGAWWQKLLNYIKKLCGFYPSEITA